MLEGRVVVITGAARGIGRALLEGFLAQGARVAGLDLSWAPTGVWENDRDDSFKKAMEARDDVLTLDCDITSEEQVKAAHDATMKRFGRVDVLVNNAAMLQRHLFPPGGPPVKILEITNDDFRKSYEVNIFGTLTVTRYFIQPMIQQRSGSIFSVVSNGGITVPSGSTYVLLRPNSREQPYQSGKAAAINIMGYLADEVREYNVAVNVLMPGHTRSTGFEEWRDARMKVLGQPGSAPLRPEHVVPLGMFLAQQDAGGGNTGKVWDTPTWLLENGLGAKEAWLAAE